jgi:hypothetical protein
MVVPSENIGIVVDGRFLYIFKLFDLKFGFKSAKLSNGN